MNILLLGSSGMVGRNIQEHPKYKNYHFFCPVKEVLDIFDRDKLREYIQTSKIDTVINAAGKVGGIQANINEPFEFLYENIVIGINIACVVKELKIPRVINLASSCIYPTNIETSISEDHLLSGKLEETNEGYALSKIVTLKSFAYLSDVEEFSYKTLIPCNLYGKYDSFDPTRSHLIASIIRKVESTKDRHLVEIWGSGNTRREFMDAYDLADAIFFALENYDGFPEVINVGTGIDYTVKEYYEIVARIIGRNCQFTFDRTKPEGMAKRLLNVEKIRNLGWESKVSLEEGILKTFKYYKEHCL